MAVPDLDKEDAFNRFVKEFKGVKEILFANVNAKENPKLSKRFSVVEEQTWPEIIFFTNENVGSSKPKLAESRYGKTATFDGIRSFVKGKL